MGQVQPDYRRYRELAAVDIPAAVAAPAYDPAGARFTENCRVPGASVRSDTGDPRVFKPLGDGRYQLLDHLLDVLDEVEAPGAAKIVVTFSTGTVEYACPSGGRARISPPILLGATRTRRITVRALDLRGHTLVGVPLTAGGRFLPQNVVHAFLAGAHVPFRFPLPTGQYALYEQGMLRVVGPPPR